MKMSRVSSNSKMDQVQQRQKRGNKMAAVHTETKPESSQDLQQEMEEWPPKENSKTAQEPV